MFSVAYVNFILILNQFSSYYAFFSKFEWQKFIDIFLKLERVWFQKSFQTNRRFCVFKKLMFRIHERVFFSKCTKALWVLTPWITYLLFIHIYGLFTSTNLNYDYRWRKVMMLCEDENKMKRIWYLFNIRTTNKRTNEFCKRILSRNSLKTLKSSLFSNTHFLLR